MTGHRGCLGLGGGGDWDRVESVFIRESQCRAFHIQRPHHQRLLLISHPRPPKPLEDPDERLNQPKPSQNQQIHDSTVRVTLRQLLL
jgi:hypothetical protein